MKPFKLDEHPKIPSGFSTPQGYFDSFEHTVMRQLDRRPKVISLFYRSKLPAVAAMLLLALMMPLYTFFTTPLQQADTASMEAYLQYGTQIPQYELVGLLDDSDLEALENDIPLDDASIEDIMTYNRNLEEYLIN